MLTKFLILFLLFSLCKYSNEFGCTRCSVLTASLCCSLKSLCCNLNNTIQGTGATTPGICPSPIPRVPPQGLLARTCTNDNQCPFGFKCCPILQGSTRVTYQICTIPGFNATLTTRQGFCPSPIPVIPPQGINVRMCNGDEDCTIELRCCPILQRSTGRFFQVCTVPVLVPQVSTVPTTTTTPPAGGGK